MLLNINDEQIKFEEIYSKYQLLTKLKSEFEDISEDSFIIDTLIQIYLHRQASPETMVGILSPKHGNPQEVADKLSQAIEDDFIDFDLDTRKLIIVYDLDENTKDDLARYQYPLPMITPPLQIKNNNQTGYNTIKNSIILNGSNVLGNGKSYFQHTDQCLDHINKVNSTPLTLDMKLIENFVPEPIRRKVGEDFEDFKKRKRQRDIFYNHSISVMEEVSEVSDTIYLTHRYDRRGRCYVSGYHVNYQGDDWHKAVIQLKNKELIK